MDLKLSFLFLDPFPKTGVISANLNEAGNFEEEIAILNWEQIYSQKNSLFTLILYTRMSLSRDTFLGFRLLISFITVLLSMLEKWKIFVWWGNCEIDMELGCFLYFKITFNVLATFPSSKGILSFSTKFIFSGSLTLSERSA